MPSKNEEVKKFYENMKKDGNNFLEDLIEFPLIIRLFIIALAFSDSILCNIYSDCKKFFSLSTSQKKAIQYVISISIAITILLIVVYALIEGPHLEVAHFGITDPKDLAEMENIYRVTLVQILGGIAIGVGLYYTWRRVGIAEKELKTSKEGQINERFTRAIDQLVNDKIEIRLGGIYVLESISRGYKDYYWPIMEILTGYVRTNLSTQIDGKKNIMRAMDIKAKESTNGENLEEKQVSLDIQAILTVITKYEFPCNNEEDKHLNLRMIHLEGYNFSAAHLEGANFRGAHLEEAYFLDAHLNNIYFEDAHLEYAKFNGAHLEKANFCNANLSRADLSRAKLPEADLSSANLSGADFSRANLEGANLEGAKFSIAKLLMAKFFRANFSGSNLSNAVLTGANLSGINFSFANLSGAKLPEADLSGANLEGADFSGANLEGANLKGADFLWGNLEGAKLPIAKLLMAKFFRANFLGSNLSNAVFTGANLSEVNFTFANLSGADLSETDLSRAFLARANLSGAKLFKANLKGAISLTINQLSKVKTLYKAELDENLRKQLEEKYPDKYQELIKNPDE